MSAFGPMALPVVDAGGTLFSQGKYIIPLYQRAFAWEDDEIQRLLDDIYDFQTDTYYLGSLIVSRNNIDTFEVIDGQQRLTALYLLLGYLGYSLNKDSLIYECRDKSNYTLKHLQQLSNDGKGKAPDDDLMEISMKNGWRVIKTALRNRTIDLAKFKEQLQKVRLFRIEVPPHTDLNRYFEVMNVRGEQLEQHDIVKAKLMEPLRNTPHKCKAFAKIWDACRDMSGYVQMHFSTKHDERKALFGADWSKLCHDDVQDLISIFKPDETNADSSDGDELTAAEIIRLPHIEQQHDAEKDGKQFRFDSIIDFPYFLLHVLKVFTSDDIDNPKISLDDKKLAETFENEIKESADKEKFSLGFMRCLLICRFLFDKYVIKREREQGADDKNGKWSLKEIRNNAGTAQPNLTVFKNKSEHRSDDEDAKLKERHDNILMLQACLRVSDTSPKSMHWITLALEWLYKNFPVDKPAELENVMEQYVAKRVSVNLDFLRQNNFSLGVDTPHLVFNYLDYLLWKERNGKYESLGFERFDFEFRNSVEHWYPQHPSAVSYGSWDDKDDQGNWRRDRFGNLCLVSREVNSKFSNAHPIAKKEYKDIINKGSLKLRLMSNETKGNTPWEKENGGCAQHEIEMLKILQKACNLPDIS